MNLYVIIDYCEQGDVQKKSYHFLNLFLTNIAHYLKQKVWFWKVWTISKVYHVLHIEMRYDIAYFVQWIFFIIKNRYQGFAELSSYLFSLVR